MPNAFYSRYAWDEMAVWEEVPSQPTEPPAVSLDSMNAEVYYLTARQQGRNVIFDGHACYEFDVTGTLQQVYPELKAKKPQKKKPALDMKLLRYELKDMLLHVLKGQPKVIGQEYISCDQTLGDSRIRHNYQRYAAENQHMYYINFKGKHLGVIQRYPHRKAIVYRQTEPKLRLVQGMFMRVLDECLPEAKVEIL